MPCLSFRNRLKNLRFARSELGHLRAALRAAQHGDEGNDENLDEIMPRVFGARIGNALERGDEELHGRTPRSRSPLKNPRFAT
jgi:hypothetical protein